MATTSSITTPQNNLFLQVFSRKKKAIALFERYLPQYSGSQYLYLSPFNLVELPACDNNQEAIYTDPDLGFLLCCFLLRQDKGRLLGI